MGGRGGERERREKVYWGIDAPDVNVFIHVNISADVAFFTRIFNIRGTTAF